MSEQQLAPHQERVVLESADLHVKLIALRNFSVSDFFLNKLDDAERIRLKRQLLVMELYYQVLEERIAAF